MRFRTLTLLTFAAAELSTNLFGQVANSTILTMDVAQAIVQEAVNNCRTSGYKIAVVVVDGLNIPKAMLRDDGALPATAEFAKMKATTALLYNRPSGPTQAPPPGQTTPPAALPGTTNSQGGIPIKVGGITIGAVAVSGAAGADKDAACASAGLAKVADRLK